MINKNTSFRNSSSSSESVSAVKVVFNKDKSQSQGREGARVSCISLGAFEDTLPRARTKVQTPTGHGTSSVPPPGALFPIWPHLSPGRPLSRRPHTTQALAGPSPLPAPPTTRPQGEQSFLALQEAGAPLSGRSLPCAGRSLPSPVHPTGLQPAPCGEGSSLRREGLR